MKERLSRLQKMLPEGEEAVLVTSPVNRRYYTGFQSSAGVLLVLRRKCYFVVDSRYVEAARGAIEGCEVLLQERKLPEQLLAILRRHRVKRLGIESGYMTVSALQRYTEAFAGIEIDTGDDASRLMGMQRAIKDREELALMRSAQAIADEGFLHILNFIEAGRTEKEIAQELEIFCRRAGADGMSFSTIIASGPNSARPHAVPGDRAVETGDFVTMDYGCVVGGYCSDMTRTIAVGTVHPRQRECYETVLAAHLAAMDRIRAEVPCAEVDEVARDIIDASEFRGMFGHGLGHCIGLEVHEIPTMNQASGDLLDVGMVTSVEPGVYVPGEFGVRIEDCVVVTKDGCESLATSPKELLIL